MKIYSCKLDKHIIFYFSEEELYWKMPEIWLRFEKKKERWFIFGAAYFLDKYLPVNFRSNGFKTDQKAFSYLHELTNLILQLDIKERKKLCLIGLKGKEYITQSIFEFNEFLNSLKTHRK